MARLPMHRGGEDAMLSAFPNDVPYPAPHVNQLLIITDNKAFFRKFCKIWVKKG